MDSSQNIAALLKRAVLSINLNRPDQAASLIRQALAQDPANAEFLRLLGLCQLRQQQHLEAVATFKRAIAADPTNPLGFAGRAEAEVALERWELAAEAIGEALRLAPDAAAFYGTLALLEFRQQRPLSALQAARSGLALDPEEHQCHQIQARALAALGQAQAGAQLLVSVLHHNPTDATTHTNLGLTYLDAHRFRLARQHFALALQYQPHDEVAQAGLLQAFKHRFWLYTLLCYVGKLLAKGIQTFGLAELSAGASAVVSRLLFPFLALTVWIVAKQTGLISGEMSFFDMYPWLIVSAVGIGLVVVALRFILLTLVRLDSNARHLLSARQLANINLFWLTLATLTILAAPFTLPISPLMVLPLVLLGIATPLLASREIPAQTGWRWSWSWAAIFSLVGLWTLNSSLQGSSGLVQLGFLCLGLGLIAYILVFENRQITE